MSSAALLLILLAQSLQACTTAFVNRPPPTPFFRNTVVLHAEQTLKRPRSTVSDPDGPTPEMVSADIETVNPDDIPELAEVHRASDLPHPIPHQPWRRGDTAGCEAPIAAPWRRQAEEVITEAVSLVGGQVLDVTWFLTQVLVTIDEDVLPDAVELMAKSEGPVIDIIEPSNAQFKDPFDENPEDIWADEDDVLHQRETEEEAAEAAERKLKMYATKDDGDPVDEPHVQNQTPDDDVQLYINEETRDDVAIKVTEEEQLRREELEQPIDLDTIRINTAALSLVAGAILEALKTVEDELQVLSRHEVLLTSPGPDDVIETQRQFDAYRGTPVIVETQDPFESNRTLKGRLVDRNSMDLLINQKGHLVTIPLNFVKCVRLPPNYVNQELEELEEDEDEDE